MSFPPERTKPDPDGSGPAECATQRTDREDTPHLSGSPGSIELRCAGGVACGQVVDPYLDTALLHAFGEHALAEQYAATGDATAARHGLWRQIEQDVAT